MGAPVGTARTSAERGGAQVCQYAGCLGAFPRALKENREKLKSMDIDKVEQVVRESLERNGFEVDSFKNIFVLLDRLKAEQARTGVPDWSELFPPKSSWWFLI